MAADSLNISIVQNDLKWEDKKANLASFEEMIMKYDDKMEVVFLPEMFSTGFSMRPSVHAETMAGESVQWMKRIAAEKKIILAGSLIIQENGDFYNRLVWMLPNGDCGIYDKRHLFAYAGEDGEYTSGNKRLIASVKGWKLNLQVCYDLRFPVWARQTVPMTENDHDPEYDVLVYVANWPEKRVHAWKTLLQARAIENQCYVVGVNRIGDDANGNHYTGDSIIVDPMGQPLLQAGGDQGIFTYSIQLNALNQVREKLPFLKDADPFIIAG
ncbi:MAG TPA: nitrilase family protein [Flavitalea sp.]|nr:nitrilase family protein [Flavitalea sp.]